MEQFVIRGGRRLGGEITVRAAKNSVLPLIACSLLSENDIRLTNVPHISDIKNMLSILKNVGGEAELSGAEITINCKNANPSLVGADLTGVLRSSIFILGPILSRFKYARVGLPGGCAIGERPIDIHIAGLKALGVRIEERGGFVECDGSRLRGGVVDLRFPSVGATENLIMAAVLAKGKTVIRGAAREPEILDLEKFINFLGGRVSGAGTGIIEIEGVKNLSGGGVYRPFSDRIAAPTFLAAAALAGGGISVRGADAKLFESALGVFSRMGCKVSEGNDFVRIVSSGDLKAVPLIETSPYPGFPTDMQAQTAAVLTRAEGQSVIVENLFESRFKYALQLEKFGARIDVRDRTAVITGVKSLKGGSVTAQDLRGGAALVIAALGADGESTVADVHHIDRGYDRFEETLAALGADIQRTQAK